MKHAWPIALCVASAIPACLVTGESERPNQPTEAQACRCDDRPLKTQVDQVDRPLSAGELGDTLTIRIAREPGTLLSLVDLDPLVRQIADHHVFESLVRVDDSGQEIEPELALAWESDPSNQSLTFHLDPEARWHDGKPVTAQDVRFTFEKLLDPVEESVLRGAFLDVAEVKMLDPRTITIRLDRPRADFLAALSAVMILPEHIFGQAPLIQHLASRAPVGSGPFRFVQWQPGERIELERSPWSRRPIPLVRRLVFRIVKDACVAFDLFRRGDLDIVPDPPPIAATASEKWRLITYPLPQLEAWLYNLTQPVFARPAARKAVGHSIDTSAIRCAILQCRGELLDAARFFGDLKESQKPPQPMFNPARAKAVLAADLWRDRNRDGILERDGVDFSFDLILPDNDPRLEREAYVVQNDLAKVGIEMRLLPLNFRVYVSQLRSGQFDAAIVSVSTLPPFTAMSFLHSQSDVLDHNFGRFSDRETDSLLEAWPRAKDPEQRREIEDRLNTRLTAEHPLTFTFRHFGTMLLSREVHGMRLREGWLDVRYLWRQTSRSAP